MNKQPNSSYCFVCGVKNVAGVQVAFYETCNHDGTPEILARFTARDIHQGYPGRLHGGVATGILDETIGRAVNIGAGDQAARFWGVTVEITMRFQQPVPLNVALTARGRITKDNRRLFEGTGELYLPDGAVAVSAVGKYLKMTLDKITPGDAATLSWQIYPD